MILKMSDTIVVKIVPKATGTQAYSTLKYLERYCKDIPAPRPHGMLELNGQFLMFMSYIPGTSLEKVWPSLDQRQKTAVSVELDSIFSKLRSHQPPAGQRGGALGGEGCLDGRRDIRHSDEEIRDWHAFERFYFSHSKFGSNVWITFLKQLYGTIDDASDSENRCFLTHGDLRQANILVHYGQGQDVRVSGIVDWEYSGFYPAFWEAVKLTNCVGPHEDSDWLLHLPAAISPRNYKSRWLLDLVWDKHVD